MARLNFISFIICFILICLKIYSCGPSAEEIAKQKTEELRFADNRRIDSLVIVIRQKEENLLEKQRQDSTVQVELERILTETLKERQGSFSDPRDSKLYKTIKIGTQTWIAENLAFKPEKGYWACDLDTTNIKKYGYLYDWAAANLSCPQGWHLPGDDEWTILTNFLGGENNAGVMLKSPDGWYSKKDSSGNGSNFSGFSALPGGYRISDGGSFNGLTLESIWWSSSQATETEAWCRLLSFADPKVDRKYFATWDGYSVRCLRDKR